MHFLHYKFTVKQFFLAIEGSGSRDSAPSNLGYVQQMLQMETIGGCFSDDFLRTGRESTFRGAFRRWKHPVQGLDKKWYSRHVYAYKTSNWVCMAFSNVTFSTVT